MKDWHLLNDQIDETIVEWNRVHPKGANYLDLHWMTLHGAIRFVETEIRQRSSGVIKLETGVGHNSKTRNVSRIRERILRRKWKGYTVRVSNSNPGVLILEEDEWRLR